jgi:hypothetical protein
MSSEDATHAPLDVAAASSTVTIPAHVDARWVATLDNNQLVAAESLLHADFYKHESAEKKRRGARYNMLRGPADLVNAWMRWLLVNNATRTRGLTVYHRR